MCCTDMTAPNLEAPCCQVREVPLKPSSTAPVFTPDYENQYTADLEEGVNLSVVQEPTEECSNCSTLADVQLMCKHYYCYLCYDRGRDKCNSAFKTKKRVKVYTSEPDRWYWEWRWFGA